MYVATLFGGPHYMDYIRKKGDKLSGILRYQHIVSGKYLQGH